MKLCLVLCLMSNFSTVLLAAGIGAAATVAIPVPAPKPALVLEKVQRFPALIPSPIEMVKQEVR